MKTTKTIIFDLGGVLIDWNPDYVYKAIFKDEEKLAWFYREICTMDWNENQDAGYPLDRATQDRIELYPEYENWIRMYYGRWEEMLGGAIESTVEILQKLKAQERFRIVALTNWSAETFPIALDRYEFLNWFEGIVVSGIEKTRKPFPEIYHICLDRFNFRAQESFFIDDNLKNIEAAENLGIQTHLFTSAEKLRQELIHKGLLNS